MTLEISDGANLIVKSLQQSGYEAYIVGGAVRDLVMGKTPHDYDITTSAKPAEIKSVFKKTIDTGIAHGTVTVVESGVGYEVTTFRTEDSYADSRHPDSIAFVADIKEDLVRRDFTINAMCYNEEVGVLDYYGGRDDIAAKLVRTVGTPEKRFTEDALRMLRAIRFSAVLGFEIEEKTAEAIKKCAALIRRVSSERILGELNKILLSDNPYYIGKLRDLGLMRYIIPELDICFDTPQRNKYHIYDVGTHILHATAETKRDLILRWAALLHDIGKPICMSTDQNGIIHFYGHHKESTALAENVLRRLKMDNDSRRDILVLVENHDVRIDPTPPSVKRMLTKVGDVLFPKLLSLQISDNRAKNEKFLVEKLNRIDAVRAVYEKVVAEGQPYMLSDLVVNGRDLIKLGFKAGREIGDTLKILLGEVLISPELNTREYLIKRAKEIRRKGR
ncbi:MAG: CCA tRNA nucleotidyltransferase [Eubacteriales bacterium]|nr:CCA tRNA nucleotidyltransferase [Eubacteriales bacterium]